MDLYGSIVKENPASELTKIAALEDKIDLFAVGV